MAIRSFLAFELPPIMREGVEGVHRVLQPRIRDVRWVLPGNIHLTVVFLGGVEPDDMEAVRLAAGNVCRQYGPFQVALDGTGTFGGRRRPRVLWAGLSGDLERMAAFRDELQTAMKSFGVNEERRPFKPHLTLARFREYARPGRELQECLEEQAALKSEAESLNELVLFRSELKPGGAVYTRLDGWPLSGSR